MTGKNSPYEEIAFMLFAQPHLSQERELPGIVTVLFARRVTSEKIEMGIES